VQILVRRSDGKTWGKYGEIPLQQQDQMAPSDQFVYEEETNKIKTNGVKLSQNERKTDRLQEEQQADYAVMIDCGSSGSRVHIYQWPSAAVSDARSFAHFVRPLMDLQTGQPASLRTRPGISSYAAEPHKASGSLRPLMQFAERQIPPSSPPRVPVYILATGGVRLLEVDKQRALLATIERDLRAEFGQFKAIKAEVVSGQQEGASQWLSVNTAAGRLGAQFDQAQGMAFFLQPSGARRLAVVEMGGASVQVAFELSSGQLERLLGLGLKHQPEALRVFEGSRLGYRLDADTKTSVFSSSFLGFGSDSVRSLAVDLLVRDARAAHFRREPLLVGPNSSLLIEDPCLSVGAREVHEKPLEILHSTPGKTVGYTLGSGGPENRLLVRLFGVGNFGACRVLLARLVVIVSRERTICRKGEELCACALIGTDFVPWFKLQFVGLGQLFYTQGQVLQRAGLLDAAALQVATKGLCSTTLDQLNSKLKAKDPIDEQRNLLACFKATWVLTFLSIVLKMPMKWSGKTHNLTTLDPSDRDPPLDWTLGALMGLKFNPTDTPS